MTIATRAPMRCGIGLFSLLWSTAACYEGVHDPLGVEQTRAGAELAFPGAEAIAGQGRFFVEEEFVSVEYELREGFAVHQGDIILGHVDALTPVQRGETNIQAAAVRPDLAWPGRTVPYVLSDVGHETRTAFEAAARHWEARTVLVFVPRTTEADYVEVIEGKGCWSNVGRMGGVQQLSLGPGCATIGIAAHEIGHAIGFWHEQARSDRDRHVQVHWENIREGHERNFYTYDDRGRVGADVGAYDSNSIMQYDSGAFSVDPWTIPTITRLDGSWISANREGLGAGDIRGAIRLYGRPASPPSCSAGLRSGDRLDPGQRMPQCNERFELVMQADGNLALYHQEAGVVLWSSRTEGNPGAYAHMQPDGNLVVYLDDAPLWSSGTEGHPGARLQLRTGGNLRILSATRDVLWQTRTGGH